jgi:hypothetical protein
LEFSDWLVFAATGLSACRERNNRGARIAAPIEIATIPRMNAPSSPTTHGQRLRRGSALFGGTYEGGWYAAGSLPREETTVDSSSGSTVVSGVPSSIQKLRFGSV